MRSAYLKAIAVRLPIWGLSAVQIGVEHLNQGLTQWINRVQLDLQVIEGKGPIYQPGATAREKVDATVTWLHRNAQETGVVQDRADSDIHWPIHDSAGG